MRSSQLASADPHGGLSHPRTKRPLPQHQLSRAAEDFSHTRQSTISELFSSSPAAPDPSDADVQPKKRLKSTPTDIRNVQSNTLQGMINSSTSANRKCNVVDLTGEAQGDPSKPVEYWNADIGVGKKNGPKFQPYIGAKRLDIKNLKQTQRTTPDQLLKRTWTRLEEALTAIFRGDRVCLSLEELYRGVEAVSRLQGAAQLSQLLNSRCKDYVRSTVKAQLLQLAGTGAGNVEVLHAVHDAWMRWSSQVVSSDDSCANSV